MANPARISGMIGPEFPPSPKEGARLAVCVGVLGSVGKPTITGGV